MDKIIVSMAIGLGAMTIVLILMLGQFGITHTDVNDVPEDNNGIGSIYVVWTNSSSPVVESSVPSSLQILLRASTNGGGSFGPVAMVQDVVNSEAALPEFGSIAPVIEAIAMVCALIVAARRFGNNKEK